MPKKAFNMRHPSMGDKEIVIYGPGDIRLEVDYDDVDHKSVLKGTKRIVSTLNKAWEEEG